MLNLPENLSEDCRRLREELESLPAGGQAELSESAVLSSLPASTREHSLACAVCVEVVSDLVNIRRSLRPLATAVPEAGPWFSGRVMAAIKAKENELEERWEGVWFSIRRLAPRLVALCALLLVLGGTWALQLRQSDLAKQEGAKPFETVFETSGQGTPFSDEVLLPAHERQR